MESFPSEKRGRRFEVQRKHIAATRSPIAAPLITAIAAQQHSIAKKAAVATAKSHTSLSASNLAPCCNSSITTLA
jgi:hypothetical protein